MATERSIEVEAVPGPTEGSPDVESLVRRFGIGHVVPGLIGLVGPLVFGNDDSIVNWEPGQFLGVVTVNGPHSLLHVTVGVLGLLASRDRASARTWLGACVAFFAGMAAMGWRRFGFERGVHMMGPFAVDGWGNVGHVVIAALSLGALRSTRNDTRARPER